MLEVRLRDGESLEELLGRFRKVVQRSGVLREVRTHAHFISKSEKARIAARKSARKRFKRAQRGQTPGKHR